MQLLNGHWRRHNLANKRSNWIFAQSGNETPAKVFGNLIRLNESHYLCRCEWTRLSNWFNDAYNTLHCDRKLLAWAMNDSWQALIILLNSSMMERWFICESKGKHISLQFNCISFTIEISVTIWCTIFGWMFQCRIQCNSKGHSTNDSAYFFILSRVRRSEQSINLWR